MTDLIQVLVVGAGPVGLTVAHELTRRQVRVRIVDAAAAPAVTSRALATHPRTLETYDQMGLFDEILPRGQHITGFTLFRNGRRLARLDADYSTLPTRFPYTLIVDQVSTEEVLRGALAKLGVTVEWGVELQTLTQDVHGVRAMLRHSSGVREDMAIDWLVGCDGGHSTVRKQLELTLTGDSSETWLLADAEVRTGLPRNSIYWIKAGHDSLMAGPMPGGARWRMLDTVDTGYDGDGDAVAERFSRKLSRGVGHTVEVARPTWVSVFTAQQRMVAEMRVGRCFVAGDAAHVHSPASGQGMNTGIQEAYNLAWKLAMVVHGQARPELLDTYSSERVPIGRALLESTKKSTALIQQKSRLASLLLPIVFGLARRVRPMRVRMQREALGAISGLHLDYSDSPLTSPDAHPRRAGVRPGERVSQVFGEPAGSPGWTALREEMRAVGWTLLAFAEPSGPNAGHAGHAGLLAAGLANWLSVRVVVPDADAGVTDVAHALCDPDGSLADGLGARPGDWLLIRPDGYLAARGDRLSHEALGAALAPVALTRPLDAAAAQVPDRAIA